MKATIYKVIAETMGDTVTNYFPTLKAAREFGANLHAAICRCNPDRKNTFTTKYYKLVSCGGMFEEWREPIDTETLDPNK